MLFRSRRGGVLCGRISRFAFLRNDCERTHGRRCGQSRRRQFADPMPLGVSFGEQVGSNAVVGPVQPFAQRFVEPFVIHAFSMVPKSYGECSDTEFGSVAKAESSRGRSPPILSLGEDRAVILRPCQRCQLDAKLNPGLDRHPRLRVAMYLRMARRLLWETDKRLLWKLAWNAGFKGMRSIQRHKARMKRGEFFPPFLYISIINSCNLRCQGCWVDVAAKQERIEADAMDRLITEAKAMGNSFFGILGGEPFMHGDLMEILARHTDCYFQV